MDYELEIKKLVTTSENMTNGIESDIKKFNIEFRDETVKIVKKGLEKLFRTKLGIIEKLESDGKFEQMKLEIKGAIDEIETGSDFLESLETTLRSDDEDKVTLYELFKITMPVSLLSTLHTNGIISNESEWPNMFDQASYSQNIRGLKKGISQKIIVIKRNDHSIKMLTNQMKENNIITEKFGDMFE